MQNIESGPVVCVLRFLVDVELQARSGAVLLQLSL